MKYLLNFLAPFILLPGFAFNQPVKAIPGNNVGTDTMVNYCKLVRAAVKYGELSTLNKTQLSDLEVKEFNDLWKDVFDVEFYQTGISNQEFTNPRFREGNYDIFPSSKLYNPRNPDTYSLFHIGKEIGKINSKAYQNCPSCAKASIDKINELLNKTGLLSQFAQLWLNVSSLKTFTSAKEITDFWLFLRCYTIDDRVNPKSEPYFISLPPSMRTPDTTIIHCKEEIKPKVSVGWRHCEIGGRIDTAGPVLIKGFDNCSNAVYRITFNAKDLCNKSARADQYFRIVNDDPQIFCLPDTIIDCIENYRDTRPQGNSSCKMNFRITSSKPVLISGIHNCPDALYQVNYILKDSCGREARCSRKIRILNDGPSIICPPDQTVTCFDKIQKGVPTYKTSCQKYPNIIISDPVLVSGKRNCPGSIYEITYSLTDSCGRTASCVQKFTISNAGPKIKCPQPKEILCEEDITVGLPESIQVSCDLAYTVTTTNPKLIYGKPNCVGAIYEVIYTVTDECGRKDSCQQVFSILKDDLEITCPPDQRVKCFDDIKPSTAVVKIPCKIHFTVSNSEPELVSGVKNCNGAIYNIIYTIEDECGRKKTCVQKFTISNDPPEIECGPEIVVPCLEDIKHFRPPQPGVSCNLTFTLNSSEPIRVSGTGNCNGAKYKVVHTVEDECGRKASCTQLFRIESEGPRVTCPPDRMVKCSKDIIAETLEASGSCGEQVNISVQGPLLITGKPDCPNAKYSLIYTITDECKRTAKCIQYFTLFGDDLSVICPPDITVNSKSEIKASNLKVTTSCGVKYKVTTVGPILVRGVDGEGGAEYEITYTITDDCDQRETCKQLFTLNGPPAKGNCVNCDCLKRLQQIPLEIKNKTTNQVTHDFAILVKKYGCKKLKEMVQGKLVELFGAWSSQEILGTGTGIASDIARRGDINIVIQNLSKIEKAIEILEEAINGEPKKALQILGEFITTQGLTSLTGSGTPAAVFTAVKTLGDFAKYLNNEILKINLKTIAGMAEKNPDVFCVDYYLRVIARIHEIKPGDRVTWKDGNYPLRSVIWEYAQQNMNINLGPITDVWKDPVKYKLLQTVVYTMLKEVCDYFCYKLELKNTLNKLIVEQNLLQRFYSLIEYIRGINCQGIDEKPDCNAYYPNSEAVWNEDQQKYECKCKTGYEWNAARTACVQTKPDCNAYYPNSEARLNPQTNTYECYCITGYEWNETRTACVVAKPDCNSYYPNSEARLNPQTNTYECYCKQGYEWNSTRTACVVAKPDCNAYYPNSEARLNPLTNTYECYCKTGYEWNASRTACVPSAPDCNSYYPNSEPKWNAQKNMYECYCKPGYQWNASRTACEPSAPDCNSYYPNSEPKWNYQTNTYECYCKPGFQWNATRTACVPVQTQVPDCNAYYANSEAKWNSQKNVYECYCKPGYEWNATRTACILANRDNPPVNPNQQKQGVCNTTYRSGANEPEQYTIMLTQTTGSVDFSYSTYTVKDRIHIYQGATKIFDSGCVGVSSRVTLTLNGNSNIIRIVVDPQCEPNETQSTQWDFNFGCPR
jgi:hypothetical protein